MTKFINTNKGQRPNIRFDDNMSGAVYSENFPSIPHPAITLKIGGAQHLYIVFLPFRPTCTNPNEKGFTVHVLL